MRRVIFNGRNDRDDVTAVTMQVPSGTVESGFYALRSSRRYGGTIVTGSLYLHAR
jgi:hypothetical protein